MNKKAARMMLVFLLTVACAVSIGIAQGKKATLTGHLVDQMCGAEVKDAAKAADHSKECALMDIGSMMREALISLLRISTAVEPLRR